MRSSDVVYEFMSHQIKSLDFYNFQIEFFSKKFFSSLEN
jgi:hypothetical protein